MISIIIPVYQAEKHLSGAVESVLAQTYKEWELILIDDGSNDASGAICDDYVNKNERIRVLHKSNGGQSSARNKGLEMAKGKYIYWMDNDDIIFPEACEILLRNMEQYGADISVCSYLTKDDRGGIGHNEHLGNVVVLDNKEGLKSFLTREVDIYIWTKLYRKSFLDKYNIRFEEGRSDEDFLFNALAFAYSVKTVVQDIPVYIYSIRKNSTCRQFPKLRLKKYIDDTWYRIMKIEALVAEIYPQYTYLAKRQSILYIFIILGTIIDNEGKYIKEDCRKLLFYIHQNRWQVIHERKFWHMSLWGVLFATFLPYKIYFMVRKYKRLLKK